MKFVDGNYELFEFDLINQLRSNVCSYHVFQKILKQLETEEQGIDVFTSAYKHFGIHVNPQTNEINIKEWAPGAKAMDIKGDFSSYFDFILKTDSSMSQFQIDNWQDKQYPLTRDQWGVWRGIIPPLSDGSPAIKHGQAIKVDQKDV